MAWLRTMKTNGLILKTVPVLFYKRYVDDIFCLFKCETDAERFLTFLNRQHPNIKFTIETSIFRYFK